MFHIYVEEDDPTVTQKLNAHTLMTRSLAGYWVGVCTTPL